MAILAGMTRYQLNSLREVAVCQRDASVGRAASRGGDAGNDAEGHAMFDERQGLFATPPERIDVVIHPQSIVHSMVEYVDGSVLAQLGIEPVTESTADFRKYTAQYVNESAALLKDAGFKPE